MLTSLSSLFPQLLQSLTTECIIMNAFVHYPYLYEPVLGVELIHSSTPSLYTIYRMGSECIRATMMSIPKATTHAE